MDGQDKGLITYRGETLVQRQIDWLAPQVNHILISANRNFSQYQEYGLTVVQDAAAEYSGPLHGICAGLNVCESEWLFVHPVDMPGLPDNIIEQISNRLIPGASLYYLASSERAHYLSMLIRCSERSNMLEYLGVRDPLDHGRVKDYLSYSGALKLDLDIPEKAFRNLNTPKDFSDSIS